MATILDLPGISATILVDDEPVREYHATNMSLDDREASLKKAVLSAVPGVNPDSVVLSDVKFTVRYIEAISGKNFALRFDKLAGFYRNAHHLGVKWQVDGYETNIRHEPMDELNSETHWTATSSRVGTGDARRGWSWQYFKFGDLKRSRFNRAT